MTRIEKLKHFSSQTRENTFRKREIKSAGRSVVESFEVDSAIAVERDDSVGEDQRNIVRSHSNRMVVAETCLVY